MTEKEYVNISKLDTDKAILIDDIMYDAKIDIENDLIGEDFDED